MNKWAKVISSVSCPRWMLYVVPVLSNYAIKSFFPHQASHSPVNVLLDVLDIQHASAPCRLDDFCDQLRMANRLSRLHDSDHSSLTLKVSVLSNTFVRLFVLLLRLLELHLIDLDSVLVVPEAWIDCEGIQVGVSHKPETEEYDLLLPLEVLTLT
ncbi:hypothetical protein KCU90_g61, partial [Aureobasidium melanogenum]